MTPYFQRLAAAAFCLIASPAIAEDFGISELRGGFAISSIELYAGAWVVPDVTTVSLSNLDSVQADILFDAPDVALFEWIGSPRLDLGGVLNLRGRESVLHAGLNWQIDPFDGPFFFEAGLGLGVHNGSLWGAPPPARNMGCRVLFHWSLGVGMELTDNTNLVFTQQHVSHAGLCGPAQMNMGINHWGLTLGYEF